MLTVTDRYLSRRTHYYLEACEALKEEGLKYLEKLCQKATEVGVNVEFTQNLGDPGRIICEIARSCDADLINDGSWWS